MYTGLIEEDDNGRTDLGTLEKKLQDQDFSRRASIAIHSDPPSPTHGTPQTTASHRDDTPNKPDHISTPQSHSATPSAKSRDANKDNAKDKETTPRDDARNTPKDKSREDTLFDKSKDDKSSTPEKTPEEVEALSDMMCSLVTNNCGETRYIGQ